MKIEMETTQGYDEWIEKFKPKKTTDDCFTPPKVYEAVKRWAIKEYSLEGRAIERPFFPGGDYENYKYTKDCVVIDNPPFSILSKIIQFYEVENIDFFLFAPTLTVFSAAQESANAIITGRSITYENGAKVNTSFVTNLGLDRVRIAGSLNAAIDEAQKEENKKELERYEYPANIISAARLQKIASQDIELKIKKEECIFIRTMDEQRRAGKSIYGAGYIISDHAAAEKAAAEKAAE